MVAEGESAEPMFSKYSSFKDAVTNLASMSHFSENDWEEEYFDLDDRDLLRKMVDGMPTLDFSERLYSLIEKNYCNVLSDGTWVIYRQYLTVQPWTTQFSLLQKFPENVVTWIHVLSLVQVANRIHRVEYESLPMICYSCSTYGHMRENCAKVHNTESMEEESDMANENLVRMKQQLEISTQVRVEKEEYGE
ncbi:hypothetical protein PVK06_035105 [Gossypium arboreum]|uniref:CCHC-type domain-containing protein n=1 Tax=Gossypium arboreum TaxID=29729 RepID=A0ABR0NH38_GOSAR|nr:hypothetical protein PVK06_035105 [Gossypium arboreum]